MNGSPRRRIPYDYLDKVFIGHLHVDHMGDLDTFWLGGTTMNRLTPLRIWGPSGAMPEYGTAHAMAMMEKTFVWDIGTRAGFIDFRGEALEVHEFPFDGVNEVIYNENGVVVRSIPAIHAIDGAVSSSWSGTGSRLSTAAIRPPTSGTSSTPKARTSPSTSASCRPPFSSRSRGSPLWKRSTSARRPTPRPSSSAR